MKSSISFPKFIIIGLCTLFLLACQKKRALFKKEFTPKESLERAEGLINGAGTDLYYQGTVSERAIILEGKKLNPNLGQVYRELGVPYLKRGMAKEANQFYEKAVLLDPKEWQGYWAYCVLYFYRNYEKALGHLEEFDDLTPRFIDYPQSTSVEYMKGICHLKLGDYSKAIEHFKTHIDFETKSGNENYLDLARICLAQSYGAQRKYSKANEIFEEAIILSGGNAEVWYYHALNLVALNKLKEAKRAANKSQELLKDKVSLKRPYVSEFFQIYPEDIEALMNFLENPQENLKLLSDKYSKKPKDNKFI